MADNRIVKNSIPENKIERTQYVDSSRYTQYSQVPSSNVRYISGEEVTRDSLGQYRTSQVTSNVQTTTRNISQNESAKYTESSANAYNFNDQKYTRGDMIQTNNRESTNYGQTSLYESRTSFNKESRVGGVLKGQSYQISEHVGERYKTGTTEGEKVVIGMKEGESRIKSQTTLPGEARVVSEVELQRTVQRSV